MSIDTRVNKFTKQLPSPLASLTVVSDSDLREKAKIENGAELLFKEFSKIVLESIKTAIQDTTKTVNGKGKAVVIELPQKVVMDILPADLYANEASVVDLAMKNVQAGLKKRGFNAQYLNLSSYNELVSGHLLVVGIRVNQELSGITQEIIRSRVPNAA